MALTRPTNALGVWRRIWGGQPEVGLVSRVGDVGFAQPTKTGFNFPIGILGAGAAGTQLAALEEGIYDITFSLQYQAGGIGDQQMAFRAKIVDGNGQAVWSQLIAIGGGNANSQRVEIVKRCAIRQGHAPALFNEQAWTLVGTFAVTAITADPVFS